MRSTAWARFPALPTGLSRGLPRLLFLLSFLIPGAAAEEITVAVATNFAVPLAELAPLFEQHSGHDLVVSSGSTGQLYAQVRNGAPYDVFLSADEERPALLEKQGAGIAGSRFTYAVGRLVLWRPEGPIIGDGARVLREHGFRHLAIANPRLAPYGLAARQALQALGLWQGLQDTLVLGENIGQAYALTATGNAELGLLALSQVQGRGAPPPGGLWVVPEELHEPVRQQAILLRDSAAARDFLAFLRSQAARRIIAAHGYAADMQ